jgi:N-acetylglucosamine kinase-like BadF-type ATPase
MTARVFVGVDSGGTRTNVDLCFQAAEGAELIEADPYQSDAILSGALDPRLVPDVLKQILADLPARHGELTNDNIEVPTYIWIGAAGFTSWTSDGFRSAANSVGPTLGIKVAAIGAANDAVSLLLGSGADCVVVAGTGSSTIVRATDGAMYQAGGHEWVATDYGSGFWIALEGIRAAFRDFDSSRNSGLLQRMRETYAIRPEDRQELTRQVRALAIAEPGMKRRIARFAQDVLAAADQRDRAARDIVSDAAFDLADVTATVIRRNIADKVAAGITVAQCGSLFRSEFYRDTFQNRLIKDLKLDGEGKAGINWRPAVNATQACLTLARRLAVPDSDIRSLPQDEFQPVIREF